MTRVIIAGIFIIAGLFTLGIAVVGIFRFSTMLNRIHVAAKCDTMGALLVLTGLIILSGLTFFSLKLFLVIVFLWLCNPAASHLIARAEVMTNPNLNLICDYVDLTKKKKKGKKLKVIIIEWLLLIFLIVCAIAVSISKNLLNSVIIFMSYSLVMAVIWVLLRSPDLAITEAAVGAGVTSVLFFLALRKIGQLGHEKEHEE